jgi:hypothetical protein
MCDARTGANFACKGVAGIQDPPAQEGAMTMFHHLGSALLTLGRPPAVSHAHRGSVAVKDSDGFAQGAEAALQAYTKASDAYALNMWPSVALWSVLIAAALVLLEWLVSRRSKNAQR